MHKVQHSNPFNTLIDPLKSHSYGLANDYSLKQPQNQQQNGSNLPFDKRSKSIDEWKVLQQMQQLRLIQQEKQQQLNQEERQKRLALTLNYQIKDKSNQANNQMRGYLTERQTIDVSKELGDKLEIQEIEQTSKLLQQLYLDNYSHSQHKLYKKYKQEEQDLQQERIMLQSVQEASIEDQKLQLLESEKFKQSVHELLQAKKFEKESKKSDKEKERQDYRNLCLENQKRQMQQDLRYQEYFKIQDQYQSQRQGIYKSQVLLPEMSKLSLIKEQETKDQQIYQKLLYERENEKQKNRSIQMHSTMVVNKDLLNKKAQDSYLQSVSKTKDLQNRLLTERNLFIEGALSNERNKRTQLTYKQTLDKQLQIKDVAAEENGTMTKQELRLNKFDLENFKSPLFTSATPINFKMANLTPSLVPGLIHSQQIGSVPVKAQQLYENVVYQQPFFSSRNSRNQSRDINQLLSNGDEGQGGNNSVSSSIAVPDKSLNNYNHRLRNSNTNVNLRLSSNEYNPILNPIANAEKNPIIRRMKLQAYEKKY